MTTGFELAELRGRPGSGTQPRATAAPHTGRSEVWFRTPLRLLAVSLGDSSVTWGLRLYLIPIVNSGSNYINNTQNSKVQRTKIKAKHQVPQEWVGQGIMELYLVQMGRAQEVCREKGITVECFSGSG